MTGKSTELEESSRYLQVVFWKRHSAMCMNIRKTPYIIIVSDS